MQKKRNGRRIAGEEWKGVKARERKAKDLAPRLDLFA